MKPKSDLIVRLRSRGLRLTLQRRAILDVLGNSSMHLTPVQVHARAKKHSPGLTEPTVYRTLRQLSLGGLVWQLHLDNGHLAYELAGKNHHHLVCTSCGDELQFPNASMETLYAKLEAMSGFKLDHDHLTLTGLCPQCQRNRKNGISRA